MMRLKHIYTLAVALLMVACQTDETITDGNLLEEGPSVKVLVKVGVESAWNVDEQSSPRLAPPPGGGIGGGGGTSTISAGWVDGASDVSGVDKVRIIAFRRKDTSDGTGTSEPFIYDARNDQVVDILGTHSGKIDNYTTSHSHPYAQGTLTKVYGYEYRVVALAYSSTRAVPYAQNSSYNNYLTTGEHNWFTMNLMDGLTFDNFMATITTQTTADNSTDWCEYLTGNDGVLGSLEHTDNLTFKVMATPQLFWGYCHLDGDNEPIIRFSTTNGSGDLVNDADLTGLLFRGMAKVELHITLQEHADGIGTHNVDWLALMADHVMTQVKLNDYDEFLSPLTPVADDGKFTTIGFITSASNGNKVVEAWVLPTRTRLAIRGKYQLSLGAHRVVNGQLCAANISYGDLGTGIISTDVVDNYFYLRRNHKYVLNCSSSENVFNNHEID